MNATRCAACLMLLLLPFGAPATARTWIVDATGGGDFTRIGDAILATAGGDTVGIRPGSYDEYDGPTDRVDFTEWSLVILGLGTGPADVQARLSLAFGFCESVVIRGITFHDEYRPLFGEQASTVLIQDCVFDHNNGYGTNWLGGAIHLESYEELTIEDCVFLRNRTTGEGGSGGAISLNGAQATLRRCRFEENAAANRGGGVFSPTGSVRLEDCLFARNRAFNGAAVTLPGPSIAGCTFHGNVVTGANGGAIEAGWEIGTILERTIIAGTADGYGVTCWGALAMECIDFWANARGHLFGACAALPEDGNFEADPRLCQPATGDYRLMEGSPCLPGEHGGFACGLIGAYGVGCVPDPTLETTWGRIKRQFQGSR